MEVGEWRKYLQDYFYNIENPGAFSSPQKTYSILKKQGVKITLAQIKSFLKSQDAYSLFKFVRDKDHGVTRVVPLHLDSHWQIDLASFQNIKEFNNSMNYMLFCIDSLSRYLWVRVLKNKTHSEIINAFEDILISSKRKCEVVISDNGAEFKNKYFKNFLTKQNIYFYSTNTDKKAQIVERVIQTYKGILYKYFTHKRTFHYLDIYQKIADNSNISPHKSLNKLTPAEVNSDNQSLVWKRLYIDTYKDKNFQKKLKKNTKIEYKYKIGDYVRVSHLKKAFVRSYQGKWSQEIFIIYRRKQFKGLPSYKLIDFNQDEIIGGIFYEFELQGVDKDQNVEYYIDRILKRRKGKGGKREVKVSWLGWPSPKFDSWVLESTIKDHAAK